MAKMSIDKAKQRKGPVPTLEDASSNMVSGKAETVPLNFRVSPEFKRRYKQLALDRSMSMVDILRQSFDEFENK